MPITISTLSALQKVGAAAFHADEKLKNEVTSYAQRANSAVFNNPYNLGNKALLESWQVAARLSKKLSGIEQELREIYRLASELVEDDLPIVHETLALSAPASADSNKDGRKNAAKAGNISATTVKVNVATKKQASKAPKVAKTSTTATKTTTAPKTAAPATAGKKTVSKPLATKKGAAPAALPTKPVKKTPVAKTKAVVATPTSAPAKAKTQAIAKGPQAKATRAGVSSKELTGNPAKLLAHLQTILNAEAFEHLNQTVVAKDAGIPLGSVTATLGRLTKARRLVAGPKGSYRLAKVRVKAPVKAPVKAVVANLAPVPAPEPVQAPAQTEVLAAATPEAQA